MISSAISADLGRQELIQGSSEALATVTGIVDGTGSIGAAVGQVREPRGWEGAGLLSRGRWHPWAIEHSTESLGFISEVQLT